MRVQVTVAFFALVACSASVAATRLNYVPPPLKAGDPIVFSGPSEFIKDDPAYTFSGGTCTPDEQAASDARYKKRLQEIDQHIQPLTEIGKICSGAGVAEPTANFPTEWMQSGEVLEVRGSAVRYMTYGSHANEGWADFRGLMRISDFKPIKQWDSPGKYHYCTEDECFTLTLRRDGSASLKQQVEADGECWIWATDKENCVLDGQMELAGDYLRLPSKEITAAYYFQIDLFNSRAPWRKLCPVAMAKYTFKCTDMAVHFEQAASPTPPRE